MRCITAVGLSAALVTTMALPAMAGGWWTHPQLEHQAQALGIGETTTVTAEVMFSTADEAVEARTDGAWYAYLVRGIDTAALQEAMTQPQPEDWWSTPQETILLGRLAFGQNDSNLSHASVTFVVPDVKAGAYDLMLCTLGCSEPLADVLPLQWIYVGDPAAALIMRDSRFASDDLMREVGHVGSLLDRLGAEVGTIGNDLGELAARVDELAVAEQPPDNRAEGTASWLTWAGWFVAGITVAWSWANQRRGVVKDTDESVLVPTVQILDHELPAEPEFVTRR